MAFTTYLVQAFDTQHIGLDTDHRGEGFPTVINGAHEMLEFLAVTNRGVRHDWDVETHQSKLIAYWVVCVNGIARDIYTTTFGRTCTRCMAAIPKQGPGCRDPRPVPTRHVSLKETR